MGGGGGDMPFLIFVPEARKDNTLKTRILLNNQVHIQRGVSEFPIR